MANETTTIKLSKETKKRLDNFREYNAESYEELLRKLLYVLNAVRKNPDSANKILSNIDKSIKRKRAMSEDAKNPVSGQNLQQHKETR